MENRERRVDLSIDNPILDDARQAMTTCMRIAVERAIRTGSMEGSVSLRVAFTLTSELDEETGEIYYSPEIAFKSSYTVPIKDSIDGKVMENSRLMQHADKWLLANNQISMDELLGDK